MVVAERGRVEALPQLEHEARRGFVLESLDLLEGERLDRLEFLGGEGGPAQHVGEDFHAGGEVLGDGAAPELHVDDADALAAVEAEFVLGEHQGAVVAITGPARHHAGDDAGEAGLTGGVVGAAGGDEEIHRRRADVGHRLGEEGEAVGEAVLEGFLGHVIL